MVDAEGTSGQPQTGMPIRPYQEDGVAFLASRRHALLAWDMRLGKSMASILAAQQIGARNVLVVCPAIATTQWAREWKRWANKDAAVLDSGVWPVVGTPLITSYDRAVRCIDILRHRWDLVIVDECHYARNPDAKRTKVVYGKNGLAHCAERLWALSGTPAPRDASDLWPLLYTFGATTMTRDEFVRRYCYFDETGEKVKGTKQAMIPELKAILAPFTLRRTRKDVAPDMPDIDFQFLAVKPKNEADYRVPDDLEGEALLAWLEAHRGESAETRQEVAMAKAAPLAEAVVEDFDAGLLDQTVIFAYHRSAMDEVARRLGERGLSVSLLTGDTPGAARVAIQDDFKAGKTQVVLAQIIAAGTAIDLSAARHAYALELDWLPANNLQAANRLVNMDKQDKVTVDVVTWPGSYDDVVQRVLVKRARELSELF